MLWPAPEGCRRAGLVPDGRLLGVAVAVITVERVVHHPPEAVFDFVATRHFENHPRWDSDLLEMRQTSSGGVGPGTTASVVRRQGRRRVEGTATVIDYQPHRRAAWEVRFGAFALHQVVDLLPEPGGAATRVRLSIETRVKGPVKLLLPLLRGRFRRTMTRSLASIESLLGQSK